jgi:hypothetical protein
MTMRLVVQTQTTHWGSEGLELVHKWYYLQEKVEGKWVTQDIIDHECLTVEETKEILSHVPRWLAEGKIKV